jgi:hypothetical protein
MPKIGEIPNGRVSLLFLIERLQLRFLVIIDQGLFFLSTLISLLVFLVKFKTHLCNALGLDDMHASLPDLKYGPHLRFFIVIRCLCLLLKAFLIL